VTQVFICNNVYCILPKRIVLNIQIQYFSTIIQFFFLVPLEIISSTPRGMRTPGWETLIYRDYNTTKLIVMIIIRDISSETVNDANFNRYTMYGVTIRVSRWSLYELQNNEKTRMLASILRFGVKCSISLLEFCYKRPVLPHKNTKHQFFYKESKIVEWILNKFLILYAIINCRFTCNSVSIYLCKI